MAHFISSNDGEEAVATYRREFQGALIEGPHEPRVGVAPAIVGSAPTVAVVLASLAATYDTDDITIVGICHDHESRVYSHQLIANAVV